MELHIPEGAQVHIMIGQAPLLALPGQTQLVAAPERRRRPLLTGTIAVLLLAGGYVTGHLMAHGAAVAPEAHAALPRTSRPIPAPPPADFTQQLRQSPTITPAPGAPRAGAAPANPFGLHE